MTAAELSKHIGHTGAWAVNSSVAVKVTIKDARESFGRLDYLITPVDGDGQCWVDSKYVKVVEGGE